MRGLGSKQTYLQYRYMLLHLRKHILLLSCSDGLRFVIFINLMANQHYIYFVNN